MMSKGTTAPITALAIVTMMITAIMPPTRTNATSDSRVLELGVGCGRLLRRLHELFDPEAIERLNRNYEPLGKFVALPHMPPSALERERFDLVYAVSVFTYLSEQRSRND
jgi:hypothetical protein